MSKYEKFSKEELMAIAEKQDSELASKKYGLNWDAEREPEQVVLDCENNLPVLKRVKGKEIREPKNNGQEDNILIEGDNYHALTVLNYTHQGKIDVIYIDPPYNTGAHDWKYNNKYVGDDDGYRHSKWLNMMEKRLNLAKDILKDDGVICVTIDDYELRTLWMLMDKIFGENNHLGTVAIRNNPKGRMTSRKISLIHEYALFFGKSDLATIKKLPIAPEDKTHHYEQDKDGSWFLAVNLRKQGIDSTAYNRKGKLSDRSFPIYFDPKSKAVSSKNKYKIEILPIDPRGEKRIWRRSKDAIDEMYKKGDLWVKEKNGNYQLYYKFRGGLEGQMPKSIWYDSKFSASEYGTQTLGSIMGARETFQYPKSPYAVIESILAGTDRKDAIILDFFAGSGTTGQAVLGLNKEDGGNRKFILCTNNELNGFEKELREKGLSEKEIEKYGICQRVTYPRLEKVIKGYKKNGNGEKVEGLGGNLQYFRTDFVRKNNNKAQVRLNLTGKCTEMLCVKENIFNIETENDNYKIFSSNTKDKFLCVYYNFAEDGTAEFVGKIKKIKGRKVIYMFSVDNEVDKNIFAGVDDFTVEAIPEGILKEYEKLNKINIPVNKELIYFDFNKAKKVIFEEGAKNEGAVLLRIVLEKTIQKIAQKNGVGILKSDGKGEKISLLNDKLKSDGAFSKVEWEENKTYLAIGNHAAHGEYGEYELGQVKNFHRHIQALLNKFGI